MNRSTPGRSSTRSGGRWPSRSGPPGRRSRSARWRRCGQRNGLTRVFQNLLANALKFRDADRPLRVVISAARAGGAWEFSVADNGRGLPSACPIFEMFERGGSREQGSGIGLATCRRVVEAHGGRIWAEPAGPGSAFRFNGPDVPAGAVGAQSPGA